MSQLVENLEQKRLDEVARDYKQKGYQVVIHPQSSDLPDFLAGFRPDLVAQNGYDKVITEVKTNASLAADEQIEALAEIIQHHTDWRLELVVTNPPQEFISEAVNPPLTKFDIPQKIEEAQALVSAGYNDAALLIAWSVLEVAMRIAAGREGLPTEKKHPVYLIQNLAFLDIITETEQELLWKAMKARNAIAHGYQATTDKASMISKLLEIVPRLL